MKRELSLIVLLALSITLFQACYSFTGASIPSHIHTIGIPLSEDVSGFGQSEVKQQLTDFLTQKFTREGSLIVAPRSSSDALLESRITSISDQPVAVRAGETVTTKRISITVDAIYRDQKKQKEFWHRSFQQQADYPISQALEGQRTAIRNAEDKLGDEIMLAVIANW